MLYISFALLAVVLLMLFAGHYALLDKTMKLIIILLSIATITAFIISLNHGTQISKGFIDPDLWDATGIAFLIALMGWMPSAIDISVWHSLWTIERKKETGHSPSLKEALFDFNLGYFGTALLALGFLTLGAMVMYGSLMASVDSSAIVPEI